MISDLTGLIIDASFENVYRHMQKNILVANVKFGRSCLDLLSTNERTGKGFALSLSPLSNLLIGSEITFEVRSRKMWTGNLRDVQVLIFDTTRLKVFLFNLPQSCVFWYCISKRWTLAPARNSIVWNMYSENIITFF